VVDDNATNRHILEDQLSRSEMRPTGVDGGAAALAELRRAAASGTPYRLVLLDAVLGDMDGFSVAGGLKGSADLSNAAIVLLWPVNRQVDIARCRELGIHSCLVKPVRESELLEAIGTSLGRAGTLEGLTPTNSPPEQPATAFREPAGPSRRLRILLAEDTVMNQKLARCVLERRGHEVMIAENGKEALEAAAQGCFDVILMDVQMPEMSGFEATASIRERENQKGGHVPILAMTACAMSGDRERCLEAGMDGYISKPLRPTELLRAIEFAASSSAGAAQRPDAGSPSTSSCRD
jgi:CheY-like chemotaxis protein